ncbi:MAG: extracellular solute-binding protein [Firmicutes bacterium]|nr:extracellular solute-binding protein [Bacillota bacterium]
MRVSENKIPKFHSLIKSSGVVCAVLLICAALFIFCGCGGSKKKNSDSSAGGKTEITMWHTMNKEESATLEAMIKEYESQNPDVTINMQPVPFDQAQNKFKIAAQAGDAPDVFRSEIAWTCEEAALGYLTELDGYISQQDKEDYLPASMGYNIYQGHIYGIPQVTDCLALLYNKKMFSDAGVKVPETMDEFVTAGQKLTVDENGKTAADPGFNPAKIKQWGFYFTGKAYDFQPFMWAFGGGLIDPEKKEILINNKGSVDGLNFLMDLRDKYHVVPEKFDLKSSYDNMMAGFKDARYAMIFNGPWSTADILRGEQFKDPSNLGIAVIPKGPGGYGSPVGGHNYVISRSCKYPEKAWKFINFLNERQNQAKLAVNNNLLPTRKSTYELPEIKSNPVIQGFRAQLEVARNRPVIPQGGLIYNEFNPYLQAAYLKAMKPQQAFDEIALNWRKMLSW